MRKKATKRLRKLFSTLPEEARTKTNWKQFKGAFKSMSKIDKAKRISVEKINDGPGNSRK